MFFYLELAGTIAFAIAGSMHGITQEMDYFGVNILGLSTAVGGGIIRDLILGHTPPNAFTNPVFALTAIITSNLVFFIVRESTRKNKHYNWKLFMNVLNIIDALGLAVFGVVGVRICMNDPDCHYAFLAIFVGVMTAVGGGAIRDVFSGHQPDILTKNFYAMSSLLGVAAATYTWQFGSEFALFSGFMITFVSRVMAIFFHWSLPKIEKPLL